MARSGNSISLAAQNKVLDEIDKLHKGWDEFDAGEADICKTMTRVAIAEAGAKVMNGLVRTRHDDRMRVTAKARLSCCPL